MRATWRSLGLPLVLGISLVPATLSAQGYPQRREGFWFSGGLGFSSLGCQDCSERTGGVGLALSLGGTVSRKVLLGGGVTSWTRSEHGVTLSASTVTALIRFYPAAASGFHLTGGLGAGSVDLKVSGFGDTSKQGGGAMIGVGWDLRVGPMVSLTPYVNSSGITFEGGDANFTQLGLAVTLH